MKKSGSYLSWALYGIATEILFIVMVTKFFNPIDLDLRFVASAFFVMMSYLFLRYLMDWEEFNNPVEENVRLIAISDKLPFKSLFVEFGGLILLIAHPQVAFANLFRAFVLGMAASTIVHFSFEVMRLAGNELKKNFQSHKREVNRLWLESIRRKSVGGSFETL